MNENFRRDVWVGLGIMAASFVVAGIASWWFVNDIAHQADLIAKSRGLIQQREKLFEILAQFKKIGPEIDAYSSRLSRLLPTKDDLLDFPRQLDTMARVYGVSLNFTFQGETKTPENLGALSFTIDARGSYGNIVKYIRALETESPQFLITLANVDLSQTTDGYRASSQGQVFFRK